MLLRISGLVLLGLLGGACLWAAGFWLRIVASGARQAETERANYNAYTWLLSFVVIAGFWVWLLVHTYRRGSRFARAEDEGYDQDELAGGSRGGQESER